MRTNNPKMMKAIVGIITIIIFSMVIGMGIVEIELIKKMYPFKYPAFYLRGIETIIAVMGMGALVAPIIFLIIFCIFIKKQSKIQQKDIIIMVIMVPATILTLIISTVLFVLVPPISSTTTKEENYMVFDDVIKDYEEEIQEFFPKTIPDISDHVSYKYSLQEGLFYRNFYIKLSLELPEGEYNFVKDEMSKRSLEEERGSYLIENGDDENPKMVFKYNDLKKRVEYYIEVKKNL